jgi:hypothetical protein
MRDGKILYQWPIAE